MSNTHTDKIDDYARKKLNELAKLPVEFWTPDKITPYERNTKKHSKEHIAELKKSIKEFGLLDPIIVDFEGVIIAGHGRFEALCELGQTSIPVRHATTLTKNQADAARIAHNKTASTEYDSDFMAEELRRLSEANDINLDALGLDERELDFLTDDLGEINLDALSSDLDADIDEQDRETTEKVKATDASEERLDKILGFKAVPITAARDVRRFLADVEHETGLKGQEAFVEWCSAR